MSGTPPLSGFPEPPRSGATREYVTVLLVGAVSAGLAVLAATGDRSWGTATVSADGLPARTVVATAREAAPWVSAASLVALAGLGAVLATAGRWRRLVGGVVAGAGLVVLGGAVLGGGAVEDTLRAELVASAAATDPTAVERGLSDLSGTGWRWLAGGGGAGATAAGIATVLRGSRWPAMGRRYEPPAVARQPRDDTDLWRALDDGDDPTERPPDGSPDGPADGPPRRAT